MLDVEGAVASTISKVGLWWPLANEDQLRQAADAYDDVASQVRNLTTTAEAGARLVTGGNRGKSIDGFSKHWATYNGDCTSGLPATASAATKIAGALWQFADKVVEAKRQIISLALEIAATIIAGAALSLFTAFTSAGAAAARVAMLVARGATISVGMSGVATALVAPLLVIAGAGALSGFIGSLMAQVAEIALIDGDGISLSRAMTTAAFGAVGAPIAAGVVRVGGRLIRGVRPRGGPAATPVRPAGGASPAGHVDLPRPSGSRPVMVQPPGAGSPHPGQISGITPSGRRITISAPGSGPARVTIRPIPKPVTKESIPPPIVREQPLPTIKLRNQFKGEDDFTNPSRPFFPDTVHYMTAAERESLRVVPINGLLYKTDGTVLNTALPGGVRRHYLFVMDENGNLYASPLEITGKFHHSSIVGGKPVAGAGQIVVEDGKILAVSRSSGHYLPDADDERRVVSVLKSQGVDFSEVRFTGY